MGCIIKMDSKDFINEFIHKYDYKDFTIMVISDDIIKRDKSKHKNVFKLESLIPPPNAYKELYVDDSLKRFKKKYIKYLSFGDQLKLLAVIAKASALDNENVILLISRDERKSGYLDILCDQLESLFDVKTCRYKDFINDADKYDNSDKAKKISKTLQKLLGQKFKTHTVPKGDKEFKKSLKKMKKKELKKLCEKFDIKVKDGMDREDMIKKIKKEL